MYTHYNSLRIDSRASFGREPGTAVCVQRHVETIHGSRKNVLKIYTKLAVGQKSYTVYEGGRISGNKARKDTVVQPQAKPVFAQPLRSFATYKPTA